MKCYSVREAGTVDGKQSLKLNVYPAWTNCFALCVNAGLCFCTHTDIYIFFFFLLSVSLSCCLDNWPQRSVHVHAIVINPAFSLWGAVHRDTSNVRVSLRFPQSRDHSPGFIHSIQILLVCIDFFVCLIINYQYHCYIIIIITSNELYLRGLFTQMRDGSFQNKGHSRLELKSHFWHINLRDQTCLLIRTRTWLVAA